MQDKLRKSLVVGAILVVLAVVAIGYATAQDVNNSTNSSTPVPAGASVSHNGGSGHVCPLDQQKAASSTAAATPTATASA